LRKYKVTLEYSSFVEVEVEAADELEAHDIANEEAVDTGLIEANMEEVNYDTELLEQEFTVMLKLSGYYEDTVSAYSATEAIEMVSVDASMNDVDIECIEVSTL